MLSGLLVVLLLCIQSQGLIAQELRAGDSRAGYEREDFVTSSQRLDTMRVRPVDLYQLAVNPPLGLPPFPAEVPDPAVIDLGRRLFFDRRLSANGTLSCAMCHIPEQGFAQNELATPVGFEGRMVRRNAPSLYNVCLLYTSDAADERSSVDLGGRRIIKKNKQSDASIHFTPLTQQQYMSGA